MLKLIGPLALVAVAALSATGGTRPNVLVVITDDQGYGDLGCHGNPVLKTPNLDAFAKQAAWLKNFYVCPVCSPTRSSLLTGRYNYRTGVVDTFIGRSMMRPDEVTLAEMLAAAGYRTGLFGKWHLGDNYPMRPEDQGFQETLWCQGGGLGQPSDPPGRQAAYFDPILKHNGKEVEDARATAPTCSPTRRSKFIDGREPRAVLRLRRVQRPARAVPGARTRLAARTRKLDLIRDGFPKVGQPWAGQEAERRGDRPGLRDDREHRHELRPAAEGSTRRSWRRTRSSSS